jgi:tetratricopeptide (TPR) repeat protein
MSRKKQFIIWFLILGVIGGGAIPCHAWWKSYWTERFSTVCKQAIEAKEWRLLREYSTQWTDWDPKANPGWVYRAEAAKQMEQFEEMALLLARVTDDYDGALEALSLQADLLFTELNRPLEAIKTWERMLKINPRSSRPYQRMIYFYAMTLQRKKMIDTIYLAMKNKCEPRESYGYLVIANAIRFTDGFFETTKWLQTYPDDEKLKVAQACYDSMQSDSGTIPMFGAEPKTGKISEYLKEYPSNLEILANQIERDIHDGNLDGVPTLLQQADETAENDSRFWRYRGWYLMQADEDEKAATAAERSLELNKLDWRAWLQYSSILRKLNRLPEAERASEVAKRGKIAEQAVLELDNPAELDGEVAAFVYQFIKLAGADDALSAIEFRMRNNSP